MPPSRRPSASLSANYSAFDVSALVRSLKGLQAQPESDDEHDAPCPIANLPAELLGEIFELARLPGTFPNVSAIHAPLNVSHVCALWRAIALSTPSLWSALHFDYRDQHEDVPALRNWLSRSGKLPLDISLAIDFSDVPQQPIIDAICRYSPRWRTIRFDFRNLLCPPMYHLDLAVANTPHLSSFELHARDFSLDNYAPITELLSYTPSLRKVTWVDDLADLDTVLSLPLARLTHLCLAMDQGTLDYLSILAQCVNLEHVRITRPSASADAPSSPTQLDRLTTLEISSDLTHLLKHLILPSLKHVAILPQSVNNGMNASVAAEAASHHYYHHRHHLHDGVSAPTFPSASCQQQDPWDPIPLLALIQRSSCDLVSLTIHASITPDAILATLSATSSLTRLWISSPMGMPLDDSFLLGLTVKSGVDGFELDVIGEAEQQEAAFSTHCGHEIDVLCPRLEEMYLDVPLSGSSEGRLYAMVQSRRRRIHQQYTPVLRKLTVQDGHTDLDLLRDSFLPTRGKFILNVLPLMHPPAKPGAKYAKGHPTAARRNAVRSGNRSFAVMCRSLTSGGL